MLINKPIQVFFILLTMAIFNISCHEANTRTIIALQPIGNIPENTLNILKHNIKHQYKSTVIILPTITLPDNFINYEKGKRYAASSVIKHLKEVMPDTVQYIVGITNEDIYTTKKDKWGNIRKPESTYKIWGILGLGYKPGKSCIISTARLYSDNEYQYMERIIKITLHEIGHNYGLDHCTDKNCLMTDAAERISTVDNAKNHLCSKCYYSIK